MSRARLLSEIRASGVRGSIRRFVQRNGGGARETSRTCQPAAARQATTADARGVPHPVAASQPCFAVYSGTDGCEAEICVVTYRDVAHQCVSIPAGAGPVDGQIGEADPVSPYRRPPRCGPGWSRTAQGRFQTGAPGDLDIAAVIVVLRMVTGC
jgi:hypothetical protein